MKAERILWAALTGVLAFLWYEAREWHTEVALATNHAARSLPDREAARFWRDICDEYDKTVRR